MFYYYCFISLVLKRPRAGKKCLVLRYVQLIYKFCVLYTCPVDTKAIKAFKESSNKTSPKTSNLSCSAYGLGYWPEYHSFRCLVDFQYNIQIRAEHRFYLKMSLHNIKLCGKKLMKTIISSQNVRNLWHWLLHLLFFKIVWVPIFHIIC